MKEKILTVIGARPQVIKAFPVSAEFQSRKTTEIIVHTGQHYDYEMSEIFFNEFNLPQPHYNLEVGSGSHAWQTGSMLIKLEEVLQKESPSLVLVYGDTNSTLAGALVAAKLNIPVAHVEAGLRSFDRSMPEEINRILTDHLSSLLFCPTQQAVDNLKNEGIKQNVFLTGDVMLDASLALAEKAEKKSRILQKLNLKPKSYLLCTIHRPANTDNKQNLTSIIKALTQSPDPIIFPVHPRTEKYLKKWQLMPVLKKSKVIILPPLGYLDFLLLEKNAKKILTDSGGIQKEAYFFGVPCVTLRENTEWVETVKAGWNILVGADEKKIIAAILDFCPSKPRKNFYGDGKATKKIANQIENFLSSLN